MNHAQADSMLAEWAKDKRFVYGGREGRPSSLMTSATAAWKSARRHGVSALCLAYPEKVGIAMMPYSPK